MRACGLQRSVTSRQLQCKDILNAYDNDLDDAARLPPTFIPGTGAGCAVTGVLLLLSLARDWGATAAIVRCLGGLGVGCHVAVFVRPAILLDVGGVTLRNVLRTFTSLDPLDRCDLALERQGDGGASGLHSVGHLLRG